MMRRIGLVREVLWADGSTYIPRLLGLMMIIVVLLLPWITAWNGSVVLIDHYVDFGRTLRCLNRMVGYGQADAALAFLAALIILPFAIWWALTNKPVISGILSITSGALLTYMFTATLPTNVLDCVMSEWSFSEPYNISVGTYGIVVIGFLLLFSYYHHKRQSTLTGSPQGQTTTDKKSKQ
jgi:hypothetical protein